jgi:hypothetical protein
MSLPKLLALFSLILFSTIGVAAYFKGNPNHSEQQVTAYAEGPIEIELDNDVAVAHAVESKNTAGINKALHSSNQEKQKEESLGVYVDIPDADRVAEFFNKMDPKFPIVETITYKSRVPWLKGRSAWLSDYASHYATSRHFIARSLHGKPDYFKQNLVEGERFNVFRPEKNVSFHLIVDLQRSKLWFYYIDKDSPEPVLVKTYSVGLGRLDSGKTSGHLTPLGTYSLGSKVAIYNPKTTGLYNGQKTELITVFGSRWIPFEKEIENCTAPAKGFGIHGMPWVSNSKGDLIEDSSSLGKYASDGCIRLTTADIEELFSIVITKPTTIEIVKDFREAKLGKIKQ